MNTALRLELVRAKFGEDSVPTGSSDESPADTLQKMLGREVRSLGSRGLPRPMIP